MTPAIYTAQTNIINALSAFFSAEATRLAAENAALALICSRFSALMVELSALTPANDANYEQRDAAVKSAGETYAALSQVVVHDRLQSLQYNGIEIDTELIRIFLFGQNLIAMPNP